MPPVAPADLDLVQPDPKVAQGELSWTHAGVDKFEVLYKDMTDDAWRSLHLGNEALFGAGPYAFDVPLTDGIRFTVRAINGAGEASSKPAAVVLDDDAVSGIWFLPFKDGAIVTADRAWIGGTSPHLGSERDGSLLTLPFRDEKVNITSGKVHLPEGPAAGELRDRFGVTADEWLGRLKRLIDHQGRYRWVWLASKRWMFKCELVTGLERTPKTAGGRAYDVTVGIRALSNRHGL